MPQGKKNQKTKQLCRPKKKPLKKSETLGYDATFTEFFTGNEEIMNPEMLLFSKCLGA